MRPPVQPEAGSAGQRQNMRHRQRPMSLTPMSAVLDQVLIVFFLPVLFIVILSPAMIKVFSGSVASTVGGG